MRAEPSLLELCRTWTTYIKWCSSLEFCNGLSSPKQWSFLEEPIPKLRSPTPKNRVGNEGLVPSLSSHTTLRTCGSASRDRCKTPKKHDYYPIKAFFFRCRHCDWQAFSCFAKKRLNPTFPHKNIFNEFQPCFPYVKFINCWKSIIAFSELKM